MIFRIQKKIKIKYIKALKIEQNKQVRLVILNARVYSKQKINLTWPKVSGSLVTRLHP